MFILDRIDRELHSLKCLELKFGLQSSELFILKKQTKCTHAPWSSYNTP